MSNKTVQQLVRDRLTDLGAIAPVSSHPISIRLDPCLISQLDVIATYLGYGGRSQLIRDLLESSIEDLTLAVSAELADDVRLTESFRADMQRAIAGSRG